VRGSLREEK